ncbi:hypothetical protein [Melissospora conviva]|uniref:hypothetical protein n=1 Tax=Melissospora conviva TaxID=3388432 RepID=UPI003C20E9A5
MTDYTQMLREAADEYRREVARAEDLRKQATDVQRAASDKLAGVMREAYQAGKKKAAIIRDTGYVWSRTWVDRAVAVDKPADTNTEPTTD